MGYRHYFILFYLCRDFVKWLFADKRTRKIYKYVPEYCQHCEVMAICRDENNNWKCRCGCITMSKNKKTTP